jgi:putative hydrolase of the HAD superfamily
VRRAFAAEVAHYLPRSHLGRDAASLAALRRECAWVFLDALGEEGIDPGEFAPAFVASLGFRPLPGAAEALARLRGAGLRLACVTNWDCSLPETLAEAGLAGRFDAVVTSAEAGAPKPDPAPFLLALERLDVEPGRALHVGDDGADRVGAGAAGLAFEPVPVVTLPARLGLEAG